MEQKFYNLGSEESIKALESSRQTGLSTAEATSRLEKYGRNELKKGESRSLAAKFFDQFKDPMIIILIIASIASGFIGAVDDAIIVIAIVIINAILSVYQEGKAEAAIEALEKMSSPNAKVLRDGKTTVVDSTEVVPGDIVILETGAIVPADLRIIDSMNLKIDESSLTGESVPVEKNHDITYDGDIEIGDRNNIGHSSTIVTYGHGTGVITATGENTEIGKIAKSLATVDNEETPLQKRLAQLSKWLGIGVIIICIMVFIVGKLYGMETIELILTSISLGVAAIPEGLPAIVTIVLSLGMTKMAERNAIVKRLLAVETLGTTTFICSDKTGTLTQNEMTVKKVYVNEDMIDVSGSGYDPKGHFERNNTEVDAANVDGLLTLATVAALSNDAELVEENGVFNMYGDPTEGALITMAEKAGLNKSDLDKKYPRLDEIPFDSSRKMMSTLHEGLFDSKFVTVTKGATDIILERCNKILLNGDEVNFTEEMKEDIAKVNKELGLQALRVLSYAYKKYDSRPVKEDLVPEKSEVDMVYVGLSGMIDPARPEVKDAIAECKRAGIVPVMITGDHLDTAYAIARDLGIAESEEQAIMGREINNMSEEEIREIVKTKRVFARVSPENKVQIVNALKQNGEIASMTGDGVNDAPSLKKADIGIAMGITGTDVAKDTADVILTDDNFATIVNAVEEGRTIYSNIQKFVSFLLSCNLGEVFVIFLAILFKLPVPLTPKQLLWLNLITDSFPAMALGVEPAEKNTMDEPPRKPSDPLLDKKSISIIAVQSIGITISTLGAFIYGLRTYPELAHAQTMAFITLILAELLRSFTARSDKYTIAELGFFSNSKLVMANLFSFVLLLLVIYVKPLAEIFDTIVPTSSDLLIIIGLSLIPLALGEIQKVIMRKNR